MYDGGSCDGFAPAGILPILELQRRLSSITRDLPTLLLPAFETIRWNAGPGLVQSPEQRRRNIVLIHAATSKTSGEPDSRVVKALTRPDGLAKILHPSQSSLGRSS